jgi:hypothetical protein
VPQGSLSLDAGSNTLLLLSQVPKKDLIREGLDISDDEDFSCTRLGFITPVVKWEVRKHIWNATQDAQVTLYESLEYA